jgi:uncharacterized protein
MSGNLPSPIPLMDEGTTAFWQATTQGKLLLPICRSCGSVIWYPRALCHDCSSTEVDWVPAGGLGTVYSCTVVGRGEGAYKDAGPYVLAYVELAEGPRMLTNVVDCDPRSVRIGDQVALVFAQTEGYAALPRFRPAVSQ